MNAEDVYDCDDLLVEQIDRRTMYLVDEVDYETVLDVVKTIARVGMEDLGVPADERIPMRLMITSPGGNIEAMWMLIDAIKTSKTPIYTVNLHDCSSAAGLIFMTGHKRFMMPSARVLIHEGSAMLSGEATKLIKATDDYKKTIQQMKSYVACNTKVPDTKLKNLRDKDWVLNASECLQYNICDAIIASIEEIL